MDAKKWRSNAEWPPGTIAGGNNISTDTHDGREQADEVCAMLTRDGLGGMRKVFPVRVWVEQIS